MTKRNKNGFTIVELVVVMAVMAILACVLVPSFSKVIKKAEESAYMQEKQMQVIADSLEKLENKDYLTWSDFEDKVEEKMTDSSDVERIVRDVIDEYVKAKKEGDTGLSDDQICKIVDNAFDGQITVSEVKDIIEEKMAEETVKDESDNDSDNDGNNPAIPNSARPVANQAELGNALKDMSVDHIVLTADVVIDETVVLGRNIILDLGGNKLSMTDNKNNTELNMLEVYSGAEIIVKNGTVSFYAEGDDSTVDSVFFIRDGSEQDRSKLTLENVEVYAGSAGHDETVSVVLVNSYSDVVFENSDFVIPADADAVDASVYSGWSYIIFVNSNAENSTVKMNGGSVKMLGNGYMSFVKTYSTGAAPSVAIEVNRAEIELDIIGKSATGQTVVMDFFNSISSITFNESKLNLDGADDSTDDITGAYLIRRRKGFVGGVSFINTDIALGKLNKNDLLEPTNSVISGTVTVQGGNCDARVEKWLETMK